MSGILIRYQCLVMRKFYQAGAISADTAIEPEKIEVKRNLVFKRIVQFRWLIGINEEKYYLNVERIKGRPLAWKGIIR